MRGEESLDPARTSDTETADVDPPSPAPRHAKGEVDQGLDAGFSQHRSDTRFEPALDAGADQREWNGSQAQLVDGVGNMAGSRWPLSRRPGEALGKVVAAARPGKGRDVSTNSTHKATRRLACGPGFTKLPRDRVPGRQALMPRPQCRKHRGVRQRARRGRYRPAGLHARRFTTPTVLCH